MKTDEWRQEMLGDFLRINPSTEKAYALWCWYYVTTEDFDRSLMSLPFEKSLSLRFAKLQMETLRKAARRAGVSSCELARARVDAFRFGYKGQKEWLLGRGASSLVLLDEPMN